MRLNNKLAKIEDDHQNTILWFTEEIRKQASANRALNKILLKLVERVDALEEKNKQNNRPTRKRDFEDRANLYPISRNSPIILPEIKDDLEMNCEKTK